MKDFQKTYMAPRPNKYILLLDINFFVLNGYRAKRKSSHQKYPFSHDRGHHPSSLCVWSLMKEINLKYVLIIITFIFWTVFQQIFTENQNYQYMVNGLNLKWKLVDTQQEIWWLLRITGWKYFFPKISLNFEQERISLLMTSSSLRYHYKFSAVKTQCKPALIIYYEKAAEICFRVCNKWFWKHYI